MSRPILPFPPSFADTYHPFQLHDPDPPPPPPTRPQYAKRGKITIVACVPCRRRKTKCDGKRPVCSQCLGRDGHCQFDMTDEQRRLTFLRENVEQLEEDKRALESLLLTLQRANEADVTDLMRILRTGGDVHTIARQAYAGRLFPKAGGEPLSRDDSNSGYSTVPHAPLPLAEPEQYHSLIRIITSASPVDMDEVVRRLRLGEDGASVLASVRAGTLNYPLSTQGHDGTPGMEAEFSGRDQFGLVKGESGARQESRHAFAVSAQPIHRWTSVTDDHEWIGHLLSLYFSWQHSFFQNFPEMLFRTSMATGQTGFCSQLLVNVICAAGCIFSQSPRARREPNDPRTAGLEFLEEAVRLLNEEQQVSSLPTTAALSILCQIEGSFGRLSSLWQYSGRSSRMAIDLSLHLRSEKNLVDQPGAETDVEVEARIHTFWGSFISDQVTSFTLGRLPMIPTNSITVELPRHDAIQDMEEWTASGIEKSRPSAGSTTFRQVIALSKIVNSTLMMFFAPSKTMSGGILLEEYNKYLHWYGKLPSVVLCLDDATPHVLSLHIYYHAAVLLLFRPFLKAKFTESDVSPLDVCRRSANAISDLFAQHRRLYGLKGIYTFQMQCLLTACTIHIIKLPSISATSHLAAACNSFQGLVERNEWATESLNIIKGLVQKWQIVLPLEVETALYRNQDAAAAEVNDAEDAEFGTGRPEKRQRYHPSAQVMQRRQRLAPRKMREQTSNYLFMPFPNQPAPLLGPIHTSASADGEWSNELDKWSQGFDGINFAGEDGSDPFMGYQGD